METKVCSECGESKAVGEFHYQKHRDTYTKRCKPCRKAWQNERKKHISNEPPPHEQLIVRILNSKGIPASHGRDMVQFSHVDIVAFGCIRVEAKLMKPYPVRADSPNPGWYAGNTKAQRADGWKADIVCIVYQDTLHFFKPNYPAFFMESGELRSKILYNPFSQRKHLATGRTMELADMMQARENYKLLESTFKAWRVAQQKPKTIQIPMFSVEKAG